MLRSTAVMLLSVASLLAGCGPSRDAKEQLLLVMQTRSRALNTRDINLYLNLISPAYNDKGKGFEQVKDGLAAGFKIYESVSYQSDDQKVKISGRRAEVSGKYRMKVIIRGHEMVLDGTERLTLDKGADGWKIIAGL